MLCAAAVVWLAYANCRHHDAEQASCQQPGCSGPSAYPGPAAAAAAAAALRQLGGLASRGLLRHVLYSEPAWALLLLGHVPLGALASKLHADRIKH